MKKGLKIATVALATVMAGGTIGALAGCGGGGSAKPLGKKDELTVSIFCNAADAATNEAICNQWAAEYNAKNNTNIRVLFANNTDKTNYFDTLKREWSNGSTADIIYLAPKYVRSYAERGNILDLSQYLHDIQDENGTPLSELTSDVWQNGISYYGYIKGKKTDYAMGRPIKVTEDGKFVTATGSDAGTQVGLYGLPKDYSNFSTGYNRLFFSEDLIKAYTTTKANATRQVAPPEGEGSGEWTSTMNGTNKKYEGTNDAKVITYAVDNENGKAGTPANIINIGIPTTYRPYNFFKYPSLNDALTGGDPVAVMSDAMGGYTVTIPGFPNQIFENLDQTKFNLTYTDGTVEFSAIDVPYNKTIAHVTYTYAEYGALIWACTYYLNTFAWDNGQKNPLRGNGGRYVPEAAGKGKSGYMTVYGGEQYEGIAGATGSVLYLLPWLAANDADLINDTSSKTSQFITTAAKPSFTGKDWHDAAGKETYETTKRTIADTLASKKIQYGHDSENFIETYAAFLAIGSDWNGNPSGDTASSSRGSNGNGWGYFRSGRSLFYGAGSWDAATRNDVPRDVLDFGQMPTPIAEKYALYSKIKDANYQEQIYSNDPAKAAPGSADEAKQRSNLAQGLKPYSADEILANQLRRQDKWAARMDTVGYAVSAKVEKYDTDHAWKKEAAISLAARLTINKEAQKTLLYAGAQLPNFVSQCEEFVDYKNPKYENGYFSDMLTPEEGFVDTVGSGAAVWEHYYKVALEMEELARKAKDNQSVPGSVGEFLATKKHHDGNGVTNDPMRYDKKFENTRFSQFSGTSSSTFLGFAMKILNMVAYRAEDRDINIRMQYGLNAVRDSSMYTFADGWMSPIDARADVDHMLAYRLQQEVTSTQSKNFFGGGYICYNPSALSGTIFWTPAVWCFQRASRAQELLIDAMAQERKEWR